MTDAYSSEKLFTRHLVKRSSENVKSVQTCDNQF